ncbi:uncharacterized protein LOC144703434 [Wolffia australiana]
MQIQGLMMIRGLPSLRSSWTSITVPRHACGCGASRRPLAASSRPILLPRRRPIAASPSSDDETRDTELELLGKPSPIPIPEEEEEETDVSAEMDAALAPFLKFFRARDSAEESGDEDLESGPSDEAGDGGMIGVEYYDPALGDFVVGVVVSGNENKLDVNVGADRLGTMLTKEILPFYEGDVERSLCNLQKDVGEFTVAGRVGIAVEEEALTGDNGPGRPVVEVGSVVFAEVLGRTLSGRPLLSTRRLVRRVAWHRVRQIERLGEPIDVVITEWNTGGLLTRIEGLRAFLPKAELMNRVNNFRDLKENVGRRVSVCITRIDEEKNDLIISEREAWDMRNLREGTLLDGTVKKIFPFGAQIRIGDTNRSGLLHISNVSRARIGSVGDVLEVDEKVKVLVIKSMFPDKIFLSIAHLEGEPGLILTNKERVFAEAEEMGRRYRQKLPTFSGTQRVDKRSPVEPLYPFDDEARLYSNWKWFRFQSDEQNYNFRSVLGPLRLAITSSSFPGNERNAVDMLWHLPLSFSLSLTHSLSPALQRTRRQAQSPGGAAVQPPMARSPTLSLALLSLLSFSIAGLSPDGQALLSLSLPLSWNPDDASPCAWRGVACSPDGHVTSLSLPSTFLNLSSLPASLSSLSSLAFLNLSSANVSGELPGWLGRLSSLRALDLSGNSLVGPIPPAMAELSSLELLCLQDNQLSGPIPAQLGSMAALRQLRLGGNKGISGAIPPELGRLQNLTVLGAAATGISGQIPPQLGRLKNLHTLSLYDTALSGAVPPQLGSLSELRNLYLHLNLLSGAIPPELGRLQNLSQLLLWGNSLTGEIPPELGNCTSLTVLDLSANRLSGRIPRELGQLTLLQQLHLSDNSLSGAIPSELVGNLSSLAVLQMDNNALSGEIPREIGRLRSLRQLFLWGNSLSGEIPRELGDCSELSSLDLSLNLLAGGIPEEIFALGKLNKLLLVGNSLSGELRMREGSFPAMARLRLAGNQLSGRIPIAMAGLRNLVFLDLSLNLFSGELPPSMAELGALESLDAHDNQLSGEIPGELGKLASLQQLDLGGNRFSGEIPVTVGDLRRLEKLVLRGNRLTGTLPGSLGKMTRLTLLDLSKNAISGEIPSAIGLLTGLTMSLNLSGNRLTGELPTEMAGLTQLQSLDLSSNRLSGGIGVLAALTGLAFLNISGNDFSGPVPVNAFFNSAPPGSYAGNPKLCTWVNGLTCAGGLTPGAALTTVRKAALAGCATAAVAVAAIAAWVMVLRRRVRGFRSPPPAASSWTLTPLQTPSFSVEDVLGCLKEENLVGKGSSGAVYKAETPGGDAIAVKKLWPSIGFGSEIEILSRIRHRNIVKLLGYCTNGSEKLLLYSFVPNGNLHRLLKENPCLDWDARYRIAVGVAQGLAYLHHDCKPAILHRDVKSSNVLLDSKYEACVADFGIAKEMTGSVVGESLHAMAMSRIAGSFGYIAPEYGYTVKITEKSDVYSYGVVLLEILSGRSAVEEDEGLHIVARLREKIGCFGLSVELLDPWLREMPRKAVQEMLQTLGIALFCVNSSPSERPTMKEVVAMLTEVRSPQEEWGFKTVSFRPPFQS